MDSVAATPPLGPPEVGSQHPNTVDGRGEEIAEAVLFFATSPQFITGQILAVDGGLGL